MKVIVIDHTEPVRDDVYYRLLEAVTEQKRAKILRLYRREDRERTLIGDVVVRFAASQALDVPATHLQFGVNSNGKPFLVNHPGFHYNLSHSERYIAFVFAAAPVGIDVEHLTPISFDIAQMFFFPTEYSDLMCLPEKQQLAYFYDLWTIKESYLKLYGEGLSKPLNSFFVELYQNELDRFRIVGDENTFVKQYAIDPGYKLSISAACNDFPEKVVLMKSNLLFRQFFATYR